MEDSRDIHKVESSEHAVGLDEGLGQVGGGAAVPAPDTPDSWLPSLSLSTTHPCPQLHEFFPPSLPHWQPPPSRAPALGISGPPVSDPGLAKVQQPPFPLSLAEARFVFFC